VTPTQRALQIVDGWRRQHFTATMFAGEMWPNSPGWRRRSRQGHGSCTGKGMWFAAGCLLGKLERRGLIWRSCGAVGLTNAGRKVLEAAT
jgi:hypothetical protein